MNAFASHSVIPFPGIGACHLASFDDWMHFTVKAALAAQMKLSRRKGGCGVRCRRRDRDGWADLQIDYFDNFDLYQSFYWNFKLLYCYL